MSRVPVDKAKKSCCQCGGLSFFKLALLTIALLMIVTQIAYRPLNLATVPLSTESVKEQLTSLATSITSATTMTSATTTAPLPTKECLLSYKALHNGALPGTYVNPCPSCLSQWDQDVILERIFDAIGTTNRQCVEFGFGYGAKAMALTMNDFLGKGGIISGLNTHKLIQQGWKGSFFDAEYENKDINLYKSVLTADNIGQAFQAADIPLDVDYVSIDVDSIDVWLLLGLLKSGYKPRVISVEFNRNWMVDQPVTCSDKWMPWKRGSRIYGASAAAINMAAEMHGYKMVEMMFFLDVFLVREDILRDSCSNAGSLPSFEYLAQGIVGRNEHKKCTMEEATARLVDFPLALKGQHEEASKKAIEEIQKLNEHRVKRGIGAFCPA